MIHETIDLYEYFHIPRGENADGRLTVYMREKNGELTAKVRPAALIIPGGGYGYVSPREGEPIALRFLIEGYNVFRLHYTVNTAFPVPLIEAAMAMAYIRETAVKYDTDPDHVCAVGCSAGGHLAGMLATLFDDPAIKAVLGNKKIRPDAAILCYAVLTTGELTHSDTAQVISGGDRALREKLSLEKRVTEGSVPAFLWHTLSDAAVPVENSLMMASAYRKAGVPFELHVFAEGWHGLSTADIETANGYDDGRFNAPVQAWLPLAFTWLKGRGFGVVVK